MSTERQRQYYIKNKERILAYSKEYGRKNRKPSKLAAKMAEHKRLLDLGLKKCCTCKEILPVSEFGGNMRTHDGLQGECRTDHIESSRKSRAKYRVANPLVPRMVQTPEERRIKVNARHKAYYHKNKEKMLETSRARYKKKHPPKPKIAKPPKPLSLTYIRAGCFEMGVMLCKACEKVKVVTEFGIMACSTHGIMYKCKLCVNNKIREFKAHMRAKDPNWIFSSNKKRKPLTRWYRLYKGIKERCRNDQAYVSNGIQCFIKAKDIKMMWYRDNAAKLKKPHLHRDDNKGHYTIENCKFITAKKHMDIHGKIWSRKRKGVSTKKEK